MELRGPISTPHTPKLTEINPPLILRHDPNSLESFLIPEDFGIKVRIYLVYYYAFPVQMQTFSPYPTI